MAKYHVNPETGKPGVCRAIKQCRFIDSNNEVTPHFDSKEEAVNYAEKLCESQALTKTVAKKSSPKAKSVKTMTEEDNAVLTNRMVKEHNSMESQLSEQEHHTLMYYALSGSSSMNRILHGRVRDTETPESIALDKLHIQRLDDIIEKFGHNKEKRSLYRYLALDKNVNVNEYIENNFSNKHSYSDSGFMSTTEDIGFIAGYAKKHSRNKNFIVLEIETDKGISLQRGNESVGSLQSFEKERVLPRGMKFLVENTGKVRVHIDPSREKLMKQFSAYTGGWGNETVQQIPAKTFQFVKLVEQDS